MDSPTQALLGAVSCHLGFRQRIGRDAGWVAAVAAWSPDWDSFVAPLLRATGNGDALSSVLIHRGPTHSLLMAPIMAALLTLPWWGIRRWIARRRNRPTASWWLLYACCLVAVLTHPLLDWCTSYGTQLLWPITSTRFACDAVAIIDIFYTPILVITLLACYIYRKARPARGAVVTRRIAWVGFLLSVAYLAAGWGMGRWAIAKARDQLDPGQTVAEANAYPMIGTNLLWRVTLRTPDEWVVVRIHHLARDDRPPRIGRAAEAPPNPWIDRARQTREAEVYHWFAMGQVRTESRTEDSDEGLRHVVIFHDMRYGLRGEETESMWPLVVVLDESGNVVSADRTRRHRRLNIRNAIESIWQEMWNP